ncbi:MAG: protein-glutamate O-methyltransferase CheR [Halanaerobacter sp.]
MGKINFDEFKDKVSRVINIDLSSYKEKRVERRSKNLMRKYNINNYSDYVNKIRNDKAFRQEFVEHMMINTSEFFRNPENYEFLEEEILPELFNKYDKVKIWSAASSNGCEAYTVAIILNEMNIGSRRYELKATDIDPGILKEAREGKYKKNALKNVDDRLINKYFAKQDKFYHLDSQIKRQVDFSRINLLEDRYDSNIHLILCRNVFIYFTKPVKDRLTNKLSNALIDNGILFLGNTEYLLQPGKFNLKKIHTSFYRKN